MHISGSSARNRRASPMMTSESCSCVRAPRLARPMHPTSTPACGRRASRRSTTGCRSHPQRFPARSVDMCSMVPRKDDHCMTPSDLRKHCVGDTGIEPVTSSVSGKRSPAELIALHHPHRMVLLRGGNGIRTRVHGFAGRCLASRPSHRGGNPGDGLDLFERTTGFEPATLTLAR